MGQGPLPGPGDGGRRRPTSWLRLNNNTEQISTPTLPMSRAQTLSDVVAAMPGVVQRRSSDALGEHVAFREGGRRDGF
jgi:hypothetical protein